MTDYSLADIKAATEGNDGIFGGEGMFGFILIFFILALAGGGFGNMFGGNNSVNRTDLADSFNFNSIDNELRQIGNGIAQSNFATSGEIRNLATAQAQCCCDTQKQLIENRYVGEKNTASVVNAIHADGEATRALINANTMQDLRDRLEQSQRETMAAQFQLSQVNQTSNIVNELKPCAKPAYITCSPYSAYYPSNTGCAGCGYGF